MQQPEAVATKDAEAATAGSATEEERQVREKEQTADEKEQEQLAEEQAASTALAEKRAAEDPEVTERQGKWQW